jgi:putative DNA primase/helicase
MQSMTSGNFLNELYNKLEAHGIQIKGNIDPTTDHIQRFADKRKPNKGKDIFVVVHNGRGASFGDWHQPAGFITWWHGTQEPMTVTASLQYKQQRNDLEVQRAKKRMFATYKAHKFWMRYPSTDNVYTHPYVVTKRIRPYYAKVITQDRWMRDVLMIPVRNINYEFVSLQVIKANGFKRFWKATTMKNHMIWLSLPLPDDYSGMLRICEGYATGCSIYEAIGEPVICALNANNIPAVAQLLQNKYPLAKLIVCADNDAWHTDNPGITYATQAMVQTGAMMRRPVFNKFDTSNKPTDFNDLFCLAGIEEVENQLLKQYK